MTTAVLVMAYGTPRDGDDVAAFYTDIRRGRPPTAEQLAALEARYRAIGGVSPLAQRSAEQVRALDAALEKLAPGRYRTYFGTKHGTPKLEEVVDTIAKDGLDRLVGLVLAPHYSVLSVGEYVERVRTRAAEHAVTARFLERWHDDPTLVELLAGRLDEAIASLGAPPPAPLEVLFSAHSLPARVLDLGDRYPDELAETARLVAERAGITRYRTAWQSAGRTPEPWLGPDLLAVLPELAAGGVRAVVVCPAGFTSDHLEVLYDLDIEASAAASDAGLAFARTASLNDDPALAAALARRVVALDEAG